jgi:hypothetical protein
VRAHETDNVTVGRVPWQTRSGYFAIGRFCSRKLLESASSSD